MYYKKTESKSKGKKIIPKEIVIEWVNI